MKFACKLIHGGQCTIVMNQWRPYSNAWLYQNACCTDGSIWHGYTLIQVSQGRVPGKTFFDPVTLTFDL